MKVNIKALHPTQLYLSEKKLAGIQTLYQSAEIIHVAPISILAFGDYLLITDGHHRAYQALLAGRDTISAEWDRLRYRRVFRGNSGCRGPILWRVVKANRFLRL